jgi:hypothetical protein
MGPSRKSCADALKTLPLQRGTWHKQNPTVTAPDLGEVFRQQSRHSESYSLV